MIGGAGGALRGGARAIAAAMVAAAIAGAAIAGAGCSDEHGDVEQPSRAQLVQLATRFAPLASIHPAERWLPIPADDFVELSTLRWRGGACGGEQLAAGAAVRRGSVARLPALDAERLGGRRHAYSHTGSQPPRCESVATFRSDDYTRPFDPLRPNDIAPEEGFVLDLDDGARRGVAPVRRGSVREISVREIDVPIYFEHRRERVGVVRGLRITYWLLFGFDRRPGPLAMTAGMSHEGDWTRVSVLFRTGGDGRAYLPVSVRYRGGAEAHLDLPWRAVARVGDAGSPSTHPVVLLARGNHEPYTKPGRHAIHTTDGGGPVAFHDEVRACPDCIRWRTWHNLQDARRQPWWGYGGAWGDSPGDSRSAAALGPSRWTDVEAFELD